MPILFRKHQAIFLIIIIITTRKRKTRNGQLTDHAREDVFSCRCMPPTCFPFASAFFLITSMCHLGFTGLFCLAFNLPISENVYIPICVPMFARFSNSFPCVIFSFSLSFFVFFVCFNYFYFDRLKGWVYTVYNVWLTCNGFGFI